MPDGRAELTNTAAPALSVVIVTPDSYSRIRKTMRHLRAQTVSDRLEVLIGAPSVAELGLDEAERDGFFDVRAVEVGEIRSAGAPRARAAGEARAPLVVFAEDHSFPDPGWAETLIQAFEQGWNCLGASMGNANPATARSWADLFLNSGPSVLRESGGESRFIPWHNSAYSRELLDACAPQLPLLLDAEGVLQMRLARRGERFYQTNALTEHVNMAPWRSFAGNQYWGARLFWSTLAAYEQWPLPRRLLFAAASPALAAVSSARRS